MFMTSLTPASFDLKSHVESQLLLFEEVAGELLMSSRQFVDANLQCLQGVVEMSSNFAKNVVIAETPHEAMTLLVGRAHHASEQLRIYQHQMSIIASALQGRLAKMVDAHGPDTSKAIAELAEKVVRSSAEETNKILQLQKVAFEKLGTPLVDASLLFGANGRAGSNKAGSSKKPESEKSM